MILQEYDFTNAIIGIDFHNSPIYSFELMEAVLVMQGHFSHEEARSYLEYKLDLEPDIIALYRYQ